MAAHSVKGDAAVAQRTTTPQAEPQLCACCKVHPVTTGEHPTVDISRVRGRAHHDNPAVAHVASVALAFATEVEDWKRMAAGATDPQQAENYRKHAAVATALVHQLSIVVQDAEAVNQP